MRHAQETRCDPDRERRPWPGRARPRRRRPGRLAVVFVDRLCRRFLDDLHYPHRPLSRRVRRLDRCALAFGRLGAAFRPRPGGLADARALSPGWATNLAPASRTRDLTRTVAPSHRRHGRPARPGDRRHRALELGRGASFPLPGALWRERSGVRQGHRLLSLFTAGLYRAQELAAAAAVLRHSSHRRGVLGAWRHRARPAAATPVSRRPRPWLGAARPVLRGQGRVLRSRSLPAALQRQRRRRRRRLHRPPRQAAGAVVPHRTGRPLRRRLVAQCALADLAACSR